MKNSWKSLRLYATSPSYVFGIPALIMGLMVAFSIVLLLIFGIVLGLPLPPEGATQMRYNMGAIFAVPGFMVSLGVMAVTRNFAMALAFGSTRRDFWWGTSIGFVLTSLVTGLCAVVLLGIERVTGGYGLGAWAFNVYFLGEGDYVLTFSVLFVISLLSLFLGAFFGTTYRAFGTVVTTVSAIGLGVLTLAAIAWVVWQRDAFLAWVADWEMWAGVMIGVVLLVLSAVGSFAANRLATV